MPQYFHISTAGAYLVTRTAGTLEKIIVNSPGTNVVLNLYDSDNTDYGNHPIGLIDVTTMNPGTLPFGLGYWTGLVINVTGSPVPDLTLVWDSSVSWYPETLELLGPIPTEIDSPKAPPTPAEDFTLYWGLNQNQAPSDLDLAVGILSGPDRMEADIDWADGSIARVVMTINYGIEHIYHEAGVYNVTVTAGDYKHSLDLYAGQLGLMLTSSSDPMVAQLSCTGATVDCLVDWGDGGSNSYVASQLNAPNSVTHTYTSPIRALVSIAPFGWPNTNGPMGQDYFSAAHLPVLTSVDNAQAHLGDSVNLTGTGLDPALLLHLHVGGVEFLTPGWTGTPTHITTKVPPEAQPLIGRGAQDITVVNVAGSSTLPAALTII